MKTYQERPEDNGPFEDSVSDEQEEGLKGKGNGCDHLHPERHDEPLTPSQNGPRLRNRMQRIGPTKNLIRIGKIVLFRGDSYFTLFEKQDKQLTATQLKRLQKDELQIAKREQNL